MCVLGDFMSPDHAERHWREGASVREALSVRWGTRQRCLEELIGGRARKQRLGPLVGTL